MAEDAIAEEYIELEKEPENLNLSNIERQMLEKALERNGATVRRLHRNWEYPTVRYTGE